MLTYLQDSVVLQKAKYSHFACMHHTQYVSSFRLCKTESFKSFPEETSLICYSSTEFIPGSFISNLKFVLDNQNSK